MRWREEYRAFLWLVLSIGITYVVFVRTLGFGYTNWDDPWLVQKNPVVERFSAHSLRAIWLDLSPETRRVLGAEYLPVRDTFTMTVRHLFGGLPVGYHAASLALYLITCTLFFVLLLNFSTDIPAVATATLLFSLHPAHAETVAWISEQKSLLSLFFLILGLLSLLTRAKIQQAPLWKRLPVFLSATACFSLSVLCKSTAIIFLPLILALGWIGVWDPIPTRLRRWTWVLFGLLTILHMAIATQLGRHMGMYRPWMGGGLVSHILTIPTLLTKYVVLLFVPLRIETLSRIEPVRDFLDGRLWVSLLVLALLFLSLRWGRKHSRPLLLVAIVWFAVALIPVLQFVPFVVRFASRFLFLPSAALAFLWLSFSGIGLARSRRILLGMAGAAFILSFGLRSDSILPRWRNCETLWNAAAEPGSYRQVVTANRYHCYLQRGKYPEALRTMEEAIGAEPSNPEHWVDAGRVRLFLAEPAEAEAAFRRARDLGLALDSFENNLGVVRMNRGRMREADRLFRRVLERSPTNASAWTNRGHIARVQRRWRESLRFYRRAVLEDPNSATAWPPLLRLTGRFGSPSDRAELEAIRAESEEFPRTGKRSKSPDFD